MPLLALRDRRIEIVDERPAPRAAIPTTLPELDAMLPHGGIPFGLLSEICGPPSSGKMAIATSIVKSALGRGIPAQVAFIDAAHTFFPPAFAGASVPVEQILVVRPPRVGASAGASAGCDALWAADVLLRSHEIDLVILDLPRTRIQAPSGARGAISEERSLRRSSVIPSTALARFGRFARESDTALLLLTEHPHAADPAVALSLSVQRLAVVGKAPGSNVCLRVKVLKARGLVPGKQCETFLSAA